MSKRHAGLALVAMSLLLSLGAAAPTAQKKGLQEMQGKWAGVRNGEKSAWNFDKTTLKATVHEGQEYTSKIVVDDAAIPGELDLEITAGPPEAIGLKFKGIYKFEGEKLILCVAAPGNDTRPETFKEADGESWLFELTKE